MQEGHVKDLVNLLLAHALGLPDGDLSAHAAAVALAGEAILGALGVHDRPVVVRELRVKGELCASHRFVS